MWWGRVKVQYADQVPTFIYAMQGSTRLTNRHDVRRMQRRLHNKLRAQRIALSRILSLQIYYYRAPCPYIFTIPTENKILEGLARSSCSK